MKWKDEVDDLPKLEDPSLPRLLQDSEGRSALSLARAGEDIEAIAKLLQLENDAFRDRTRYCNYKASLNVAAKEGDVVVLNRLLRAKADIFTPGSHYFDQSALIVAAEAGNYEAVQRLLEAEKAITSVDGFYSLAAVEAAVESGLHDEVVRLREAKKMLERANENKCKALKAAAGLGDLRIARLLVENGAEPNDTKAHSRHHSALTLAAGAGNFEMVEFLLHFNADIAGKGGYGDPDKTPLRAATEQGHIKVVEKLLQSGASVDDTKPLHGAARSGHAAIVRRLLEAGALVEGGDLWSSYARDKPVRTSQHTALQEAARGGHLETVEILLEAGADVQVPSANRGRSALQGAAENGSVDLVRRLLTAGANVNEPGAPSESGRSALQAAAENGHLEVVNILFDSGAQVDTETALNGHEFSAIALASQKGHLAVVRALLNQMSTQNAADTFILRVNALQKAAGKGHRDIVQVLLDAGTPAMESKHTYCFGLLGSAVRNGDLEIVKLLLDANVDINYTRYPEYNSTPLQIAVQGGRLDMVEALIAAGADVNTRGSSIPPAIHTAAEQGNLEMVELLLEGGANVDAISYEGTTAIQAAEKAGKENILKLLRAKTAQAAAETAVLEEEWENVSEFPITNKQSLCPACLKLPLELFEYPGLKGYDWHPSLTALQRTAQGGCTFCQFFWRQLQIKDVTLPQPSAIYLHGYPGTVAGEGWIQSQITEPHPEDIEGPRQIRVGFHYTVEPFNGKRKPLPGDTSSAESFNQLASWLNDCDSEHGKCNHDSPSDFLPRRLIDLSLSMEGDSVKLIHSSDLSLSKRIRYATLSHNHGEGNLQAATITQAALRSHRNSIALSDLPLTFCHAIEVARRFGIPFLWIEELCILGQDSEEDKTLSSISDDFLNSYCTIAESTSAGDSKGLFRRTDAEDNIPVEFECTSSRTGETRKVRAMKAQKSWQEMYGEGPLSKAARALHERELSTRVIHFTKSEVLWECRTIQATEGWPTKNIASHRGYPDTALRVLDALANIGERDIFDIWNQAVVNYTYRMPSKFDNTYSLLGNLARLFKKHISGDYIAGAWEEDFLRSLAWGIRFDRLKGMGPARRHEKYIAPSWSWASIDGPISFETLSRSRKSRITDRHQKGNLCITSHHIDLAGSDPFGPISTASLKIRAPLIRGVLGYDGTCNSTGIGPQLRDFTDEHILGSAVFNILAERLPVKVVTCLYLFSINTHTSKKEDLTGIGLALLPVKSKEATYTRVGYIRDLKLKFFQGVNVEDITLI